MYRGITETYYFVTDVNPEQSVTVEKKEVNSEHVKQVLAQIYSDASKGGTSTQCTNIGVFIWL